MFSFTKSVAVIFLLLPILLNRINSSVYNELRNLGVSCYPKDSCQCSRDQTAPVDETKTCECEAACGRRSTCCIDSPYVDPHPSTRNEMCSSEQIIGVSRYFYFKRGPARYFQIGDCGSRGSGPIHIRQMCEMEKPVDGVDLMFAIPVTNIYSGITYRNYYCALCNNDTEGSVLWDFSVTEDGYNKKLSDKFAVQAVDEPHHISESTQNGSEPCSDANALPLVYNKEELFYGYWDYCSGDPPRFVEVTVTLSIPNQIQHLVKSCRLDLIASCPPDWTDIRVKVLCESYLGVIKGPRIVNEYGIHYYQYFRNAHCALCNNVTNFEGYSCDPFLTTPILEPSYPMSYRIIFSHPSSDEECLKDNEKFIKRFGCRAVICRNEVKNGKCTP